jgi:hypothetical protein
VLDPKAGVISAVVSTESVDRDGDIIRQANWDLGHFKAHPILLSSHNYRGLRNQIGEWTSMDIEGKELVGTAKYYIDEGNEEADWGFNLAQKGRAAFSVGFVPDMGAAKEITIDGKSAYEFRGQELLEVSELLAVLEEIKALFGRTAESREMPDKDQPDTDSIVRDAIQQVIKNSEVGKWQMK